VFGFKQQKQNAHHVCFQITQKSVRLLVAKSYAGKCELIVNDQEDAQPGNLIEKAAHILKKYKRLSLKDASVSLVLGTDCYESVLVDRPMVDPEEIAESLKYSLNDLVSLSASDIVADYYEFPEQPTGQDKIVAVAASKSLLRPWVDFFAENDLSLVAITVSELTLPSLIKSPEHPEMVIYQTQEGHYLAQIYTSKGLLFTRLLRGVAAIDAYTEEEIEAGALEPLATELQRSVDYFESHLRQAPIKHIHIAIEHVKPGVVVKNVSQMLAVECDVYRYPQWAQELIEGDFTDLPGLAVFEELRV
jgi:MSHA biogenesis protein MshI